MNFEIKKQKVEWLQFPIQYIVTNTVIPPFQRLEDQSHVNIIYDGLEKYYLLYHDIFLPGVISVGKLPQMSGLLLLDAQHRVTALKRLSEKYEDVKNISTRVDMYHVDTLEEACKIYKILNTSRPVELYDGNISHFVLPSLQKFMKNAFPSYCKTTKAPRGININLDEMTKYVQGYGLIEKLGVTLENIQEVLYNRILSLNTFYQQVALNKPLMFNDWGISDFSDKHKKYLDVANPFYLGLWRHFEWIEHLIDSSGKSFQDIDHSATDKKKRQKIQPQLRDQVWEKRCGELKKGECFVCNGEIKFPSQFHCGHIVSVKDGGSNTVENLEPVCIQCNLDMGSMNLHEYKKLFKS